MNYIHKQPVEVVCIIYIKLCIEKKEEGAWLSPEIFIYMNILYLEKASSPNIQVYGAKRALPMGWA